MSSYFSIDFIKSVGSEFFAQAIEVAQNHPKKVTLGVSALCSLGAYKTKGKIHNLAGAAGLGTVANYFLSGMNSYVRGAGIATAAVSPWLVKKLLSTQKGNVISNRMSAKASYAWGQFTGVNALQAQIEELQEELSKARSNKNDKSEY